MELFHQSLCEKASYKFSSEKFEKIKRRIFINTVSEHALKSLPSTLQFHLKASLYGGILKEFDKFVQGKTLFLAFSEAFKEQFVEILKEKSTNEKEKSTMHIILETLQTAK